MLHLLQLAVTPPSPFAVPPLVPPSLEPLPSDWATAERLDTLNMTNFDPTDCVSIKPRVYQDTWCISACSINFCLDDICACGDGAKEKAENIDQEQLDNWGEAEDRERAAHEDGCTVVDCPNGLVADVGKQANETSENNEDFQNGIDNWKEGEDRQKNVDPTKAYPYGLPAAGQQGEEPPKPAQTGGPPFKPADPSTCRSILAAITDEWCVNTCQRLGPPGQCECDPDPQQQKGATGQQQEHATVASAPVKVAPVKTLDAPCISLGPSSSDTNDRWCNLSCVNPNGNCPASMCECDEKKLKAAQGSLSGPAVDRDAEIAERDASIAERKPEVSPDPEASPAPVASPAPADSRH
jgi:hypothetical protein